MMTSDELRVLADQFAVAARREAPNCAKAIMLIAGVRDALEVARLVDADPAPVVAALQRFYERANDETVPTTASEANLVAAIDRAGEKAEWYRRMAANRVAVGEGFQMFKALLSDLERELDAVDSDLSLEWARGQAAMIAVVLADVDARVRIANEQEEPS